MMAYWALTIPTSLHLTTLMALNLQYTITCNYHDWYYRVYMSIIERLSHLKHSLENGDDKKRKIESVYSLAESAYVRFSDWFLHFTCRINLIYVSTIATNWFYFQTKHFTYTESTLRYRAGQLLLNTSALIFSEGFIK
eukprot:UN32055